MFFFVVVLMGGFLGLIDFNGIFIKWCIIMKKTSLLLLSMMGLGSSMLAGPSQVTVEFKDLTKKSFVLAESPTFQYKNDSLVINGSASTTYSFGQVKKYYFEDGELSKLSSVEANEVRVTYLDNQHVQIEGLKENSQVALFSVLGQMIEKKISQSGEVIQLTLPNTKGVYILKINEQIVKLIKE